jgi:alanyl-tRNA synthetase
MTVSEVRSRFIQFYKDRGHTHIPSASLVPQNDPTTLFTGSGMQPLISYLLGEPHPKGNRLVNSQKSFRAEDIEEVGDNRHTTFFEMLGNWSLGDYFKREQLPWFFEFLTQEIGIDPSRLYVTAFIGDEANNVPRDTESAEIWQRLFRAKGIDAEVREVGSEEDGYRLGMRGGRIFFYNAKKNWWSRAGIPENMPAGEPGSLLRLWHRARCEIRARVSPQLRLRQVHGNWELGLYAIHKAIRRLVRTTAETECRLWGRAGADCCCEKRRLRCIQN